VNPDRAEGDAVVAVDRRRHPDRAKEPLENGLSFPGTDANRYRECWSAMMSG
jgi:hypothetical protein